jgi:hypothetical protein
MRANRLDGFLQCLVSERDGVLDAAALAYLAGRNRLRLVLVRWQEGRALVPAQDAAPLIAATEYAGWHVRDVQLPATDPAWRRALGRARRLC